jgi:uncharacterized protein
MKPHLDVITLAVNNLERSLAFYRDGLGLPTKGVVGTEFLGSELEPAGAVVFFELQGGLLLALYPRTELAKDARVADGPPCSLEFSLGYLVASRAAVDEVLHRAQAAGAHLPEPPHDRPWGIYSGYFRDPDGHLWEVIWNRRMASAD